MTSQTTQQYPQLTDPAAGARLMSEALGAAPALARLEARQEVRKVIGSPELDEHVVQLLDSRFNRQYRPRLVLTIGLLMTALCSLFYFLITSQVAINTQLTTDHAEIAALQATLTTSNIKLEAQGLPPVTAPSDPQPGTPDQVKLITAAATASTLASLPPTVLKDPNADDLGKAVADYMAHHATDLYGPLSQHLIDNLAQYMATNKTVVRVTVPPTAAEITKAFTAALGANPQLLCPRGGTYGSRQLALSNGGNVVQYGCYGTDIPAPALTTSATPTPTNAPAK